MTSVKKLIPFANECKRAVTTHRHQKKQTQQSKKGSLNAAQARKQTIAKNDGLKNTLSRTKSRLRFRCLLISFTSSNQHLVSEPTVSFQEMPSPVLTASRLLPSGLPETHRTTSSPSSVTARTEGGVSAISRAYRKSVKQAKQNNLPSSEEKDHPSSVHLTSQTTSTTIPQQMIFELSEANLADFQTRLVYLQHAKHCEESNATPSRPCRLTPKCGEYVTLLQHVYSCPDTFNCTVTDCMTTSCILAHHRSCAMESCRLCKPVNDTKKRKQLRADTIICMPVRGKKSHIGTKRKSGTGLFADENMHFVHHAANQKEEQPVLGK
jgi:hypothetical protein